MHAMYVEKRRQKAWHDRNLRLQEFKEGDLVLQYSLKKDKCKLTPQGLGPYIITTINNGGAVWLETLDGQPMANFINGSQLKKYNEPLTNEILERLHTTKNAKERKEQIKADAQAKARLRAQNNLERRRYIQCINSVASNEDFNPPILVNFCTDGIVLPFLIDSCADINVISSKAFSTLKRPYIE